MRAEQFHANPLKRIVIFGLATAVNAGSLVAAGPLSRQFHIPRWIGPLCLIGLVAIWYVVFAIAAFFAAPATFAPRERARRTLVEAAVIMALFCAVLIGYTLFALAHPQ